jgi:hypothetical protein
MEPLAWYTLFGGLVAGLVIGALLAWRFLRLKFLINPPNITSVQCLSGGQLLVQGTVDPPPDGASISALFVRAYDDPAQTVASTPDGATKFPLSTTNFSVTYQLPSGLVPPTDLVVVWVEYKDFKANSLVYNSCSGSGSGSSTANAKTHTAAANSGDLEAVPRAYRVSPGSFAGEGPAAELFGSQAGASDVLLRYVPERSSPFDPVWRASGGVGSAHEWVLHLLHRDGGFGAVLTVVLRLAGGEARLTWVTSDWRFNTANRLTCESDEPGQPALLVRPA